MYDRYKVAVPEGQSGNWKVERFIIPKDGIGVLRCALDGRPVFPGTYTRLISSNSYQPMMSDTPAKIQDCLNFIYKASGTCLVNGLGLGVTLKALLAKPEVTHIDVVEIEQDIINLVWPTYEDGDKLTLYHDNAFTIQWPKGKRWDCAWHDIWPNICTDNLPGVTKLKRKYARRVNYQTAWVEDRLRAEQRREKANSWRY